MYKIHNHNYLNDWLITNKIKTPCYVYDTELLNDTLKLAMNSCSKLFKKSVIHYALKANNDVDLLRVIRENGFGIDCVSGGEVRYALENNFDANKIVFAGVGKLDWEINLALENNIYAFNCESLEELIVINQLAKAKNIVANIMLRVNPDIDARTHKHISTGKAHNKFGMSINSIKLAINQIKQLYNINIIGLHYHIGSQITDMQIYTNLAQMVSIDYKEMKALGFNFTDLNLGGGLGVDYVAPELNPTANFEEYFNALIKSLLVDDVTIHFELGRSLVAQCGVILSSVIYIKPALEYDFAIVDVGMNDLIRPALYDANHKIIHLNPSQKHSFYSIVGPVCESSDSFATKILLPQLIRGDKIAILSCGAYGHVMANQYNLRELIEEYLL